MQNIHLYTNGAEAKGQNPNSGAATAWIRVPSLEEAQCLRGGYKDQERI